MSKPRAAFRTAAKGPSPLKTPLAPKVAAEKLSAVAADVKKLASAGSHPVVVFDIDDTLLHNGPFVPKDLAGKPEPGAVDYVKSLVKAGATIVYLTGRTTGQQATTEAALTKAGLPLGPDQHLLLNPDRHVDTLTWKRSATPQILKLGKPVAVFDNEFANVRMFRTAYPKSEVFRLNTSSNKPDPGGKGEILVINNFDETAAK